MTIGGSRSTLLRYPFATAMNISAAFSIAASALGLVFAFVSWRMSRAPGWGELRYFALVALSAGLYTGADLATSLALPDATVTWCARLSLFFAAFHGPAWLSYAAAQAGRQLHLWERAVQLGSVLLALLSLLPGVVVTEVVQHHTIPWLDVTYNNALPTSLGSLAFTIYILTLGIPLAGYLRAARGGRPAAWQHAVGLSLIVLAAAGDLLAATRVIDGPYLLSVGFVGAVAFAGGTMITRFGEEARRLDALSRELGAEVERRTEELASTHKALLHAEKLAALGRLAAGVAHEVNNPAAVVLANLDYLRGALRPGGDLPHDLGPCLDDSIAAVRRIARIVRQLADASRTGPDVQVPLTSQPLRPLLEAAAASARTALPAMPAVELTGDPSLHACCDRALLEQVVVNLVTNAAHAVEGRPGRITVHAERVGAEVVVEVADNGPGVAEEVRAHLFEPFVTTKQLGRGTGLGLMVSRGLMLSQGGELALQATGPSGTIMRATLRASDASRAERLAAPAPRRQTDTSLRLLVVDDEPQVRRALERQLSRRFQVTLADGVDSALDHLRRGAASFDVVLCDMVMPDGGGERFATEVGRLAPPLAARTIYFTGGVADPRAQAFFRALGSRGLQKPVDAETLFALAQTLLPRG